MTMPQNLDKTLLLSVLQRLGEFRAQYPNLSMTDSYIDLIPQREELGEEQALYYMDRHLRFLEQEGFVELGDTSLDGNRIVRRITSTGEMFLQPELAEFRDTSLLPEIIKNLEERLGQVITIPEIERSGLGYKLRKSVADVAPKVAAELIATILLRLNQGG